MSHKAKVPPKFHDIVLDSPNSRADGPMGAKTTAEVEDAHTESTHIISYGPATEQWSINDINLSRNEALENEEGIVMLQGNGIVAHVYADDLAKIDHRSGYP